jgi:hypothetical protein
MDRAWNKEKLLEMAEMYLNKLLDYISDLPDDIKYGTFKTNEINERDKSVSDVICHLHEWHLMMANWYKIGLTGKTPSIPMEGYNWKQLTKVNAIIWNKHKGTPLKDAISQFRKSHNKLVKLIENISNEDLFEINKYKWTGNHPLGRIFDENLSCHYQWALKTLKPLKKQIKKKV